MGRVHRCSSCASRGIDLLPRDPAGVVRRRAGRPLRRRRSSRRETLVWTAGVKPNPVRHAYGLPARRQGPARRDGQAAGRRRRGRVGVRRQRRDPRPHRPARRALRARRAQHAVRQAKVLGDNIVATIRGFEPREYRHKYVGSVASLGLYKGVAQVYGIKLKGFPAWFMHRTYHMSRVPTFDAQGCRSSSTGRRRCSSGARSSRSGACTSRSRSSRSQRSQNSPSSRSTRRSRPRLVRYGQPGPRSPTGQRHPTSGRASVGSTPTGGTHGCWYPCRRASGGSCARAR